MPHLVPGICAERQKPHKMVKEIGTITARISSEQAHGLTLREHTTWQGASAREDQREIWPPICKLTKSTLTSASWQMQVLYFLGNFGIRSFGLGYDKEQITASETLFWVGVEVFLINICSGLKFSGRYLTTLRRQMVPPISCWLRRT